MAALAGTSERSGSVRKETNDAPRPGVSKAGFRCHLLRDNRNPWRASAKPLIGGVEERVAGNRVEERKLSGTVHREQRGWSLVPGSRRLFSKMTMRLIISRTGGSLLYLWTRGAPSTLGPTCQDTHRKESRSRAFQPRPRGETTESYLQTFAARRDRRTGARSSKQIYLTNLPILSPFHLSGRSGFVGKDYANHSSLPRLLSFSSFSSFSHRSATARCNRGR